jgi:hypothetical protein
MSRYVVRLKKFSLQKGNGLTKFRMTSYEEVLISQHKKRYCIPKQISIYFKTCSSWFPKHSSTTFIIPVNLEKSTDCKYPNPPNVKSNPASFAVSLIPGPKNKEYLLYHRDRALDTLTFFAWTLGLKIGFFLSFSVHFHKNWSTIFSFTLCTATTTVVR